MGVAPALHPKRGKVTYNNKTMIGLFLGAGFSKWSVDLPLASQLFDFKVKPFGVRDKSKLELVANLKKTWDVNNPDGLVEEFIAFAQLLGGKQRKAVIWYITRRLLEPFIWREFHAQKWRQHSLMIDENRKLEIEGVIKAQEFIKFSCLIYTVLSQLIMICL